ncbi:hypothetical protein [Paenibacillus sp. TH7-28]
MKLDIGSNEEAAAIDEQVSVKSIGLATLTLVGTNPVFRKLHEHNVQVKRLGKQ